MKASILLSALLVSLCGAIASAGEPDFEYTESVTFHIERDGSKYNLYSLTEIRQKYLSERSTGMSKVPIFEQFYEPVRDIRVQFRNKWLDESVISFEVNPGSDVFLSDFKLHTISLPRDIKVGDALFYEYRKDYRDLVFLPLISVPNMEFVKEYRIAFVHPENVKVDFEYFFPRGTVPYTVEHPEKGKTVLIFRDLHEHEPLASYPFNDDQVVVQTRLSIDGKGLNPTTVEDFAAWYRTLFDQEPPLTPRYDTLLTKEVDAARTPMDKLRIIHDYVRGHIRYIAEEHSINAFVPRDPARVLDQGYGDCKDRANLVRSLARRHGLAVYMTLISTVPTPRFSGTHISQFNHAICAYDDGKQMIFFDPTSKHCEFGNLPEDDIGAEVLVLDPKNPRFMVIPPPNKERSVDVTITARLEEPKQGKARIVLRNDFFQSAVEARERNSGLELENILSELVTSQFQKISFDYFEFDSLEEDAITFTAVADLTDFIIASPTRKYLPQMPFRIIDPEILDRVDDTLAIFNPFRLRIGITLDLEAPGFAPQPTSLAIGEQRPAYFSAAMKPGTAGRIQIDYDIAEYDKEMSGQSRERYLDFCRSFLKSKKNMFILNKQ
jgi:hypothetical protein